MEHFGRMQTRPSCEFLKQNLLDCYHWFFRQVTILCYNTTEPVMHDSSNQPNMVCVADHLHGGCPAGLQRIKSYTSNINQDDAMDQCSNFQTVRKSTFITKLLSKFKQKRILQLNGLFVLLRKAMEGIAGQNRLDVLAMKKKLLKT